MSLSRRRLLQTTMLAAAMPAAALSTTGAFAAGGTPAPDGAVLYIIWPQDGEHIKGSFWCRFGLRNMGVTHAGDSSPNMGHHHLFIDVEEPLDPASPIPADKKHMHFGAGETEVHLELPPGQHTLQLVMGDALHYPFAPPVISHKIHITVLA